jgi:beta-lactamase regulating signal transducer with metallopeptidase domain
MNTALASFTLQLSALLGAALLVVAVLRGRSAALRHAILAAAFLSAAALPALRLVAPDWAPSVLTTPPAAIDRLLDSPTTTGDPVTAESTRPRPSAEPWGQASSWAPIALDLAIPVWAFGTGAALVLLLAGLVRLELLARRATPVDHPTWTRVADRIVRDSGESRPPTLLRSTHPRILAAWGWLRPRVIVPARTLDWSERDVEIVLRHEFAHLSRRDWLPQVLAEIVRAVSWFNPLAWAAVRQLRSTSEMACDDAVLRQGVPGVDYAERLVALARDFDGRRWWSSAYPAPAMAHTSGLRRRVAAMLNPRLPRAPLSTAARTLVAAFAIAVALPIAGIAVSGQSPWGVAGTIVDPSNRPVPNAQLTLTNTQTQAKVDIKTGRDGRFEFAGLAAGTYAMEARLPGFMAIRGTVEVTQAGVKRDLALKLGTIQESLSITVSEAPSPAPPPAPAPAAAPRPIPAAPPCTADAAIGGQVRPPRKLKDARPSYPASLKGTKTSGLVVVEGILGGDGSVSGLTVIETPHPDLGRAVIDAIGKWVFDGTMLNCEPVAIKMRVNATFTVR